MFTTNKIMECFCINKDNKIIEITEKDLASYFNFIREKYPLIHYITLYHTTVWGYTDDLEYRKLSIYIPHEKEAIHHFLNQQYQLFIQAQLLGIL
ncbi:hypothetical protein ACF3N0_00185 [Moraxella atlantae]|uniref:hypothetical protein n=1 Tax=Faucicola atlantae TaxID=34059 RepID=UPI00375303CD